VIARRIGRRSALDPTRSGSSDAVPKRYFNIVREETKRVSEHVVAPRTHE